ncbi:MULTISPECIES: type VI secretion system baseplate subunit TssG [Mesorhizobium]|uniref:Type VI secretion system baseplate subunit TssG n=1 Tax=Mesorhizobium dulcispinae TaxID=3072316 RepID=A0ABU4XEJ3_9HYPH|nr:MULTISPECIES: type VI secretion system baseplate subunit TssG [unclassified Mesorhizobium]MDX8467165.1 type VI secretion system baseplate subunit TssG [Mesorhizobium sp. VK23B]MDX8473201.1 type VI secretion system baseplate subunit TssG [Mesorhizobium sp. VK23A]TGP20053.1 type VI secretion system baseplate subunit TssG [Mesorhizobium sp. M1D.F.Ca.ET.231.01.1.1]TGP27425.1 type VI secretion system baseplate subunit TssG [Mesorhizobium sp. M1D.F.Ca.ET.234.01.1.1]TGS41460.1 type VI secretion sy
MADDARQSLPDLARPAQSEAAPDRIEALSESFDFFELLRRLEQRGGLFGYSGQANREPARLGQHVRLSFSARDVVKFQDAGENAPARVTVANLGLLGPEGPMPLHLTRWVLDRLSQRWFTGAEAEQTSDTTFVDFVNILQHRMIALYYRAWADAHPAVQVERSVGGRVRAMLEAMSGIGLPGTQDPEIDTVRLRQAGSLANQVDGAERLTLFLATAFKVPVEIKEFVASWITIPAALQSRVGKAYAALGRGATIGPRVFSRQSRIELRIGPLSLDDFKSFLPGERRLALFKKAVRDMIGEALDVDLRIVLARDAVPPPKIGTVQLGRTSWLARPAEKGDADDLKLRTIVGWRPEMAEAA